MISRAPRYPFGDTPAVHFRRSVVDSKGAHVTENSRDDGFIRHALAPQNLHGAIHNAPRRFRDDDLGDAGFVPADARVARGLIQNPRRVPD